MATQEELEGLLVKLTDAGREAKATLAELHGERKALIDLRKAIRGELVGAVEKEVAAKMAEVRAAAHEEMAALMVDVVGRLEHDWREKLGI